MPYRWAATNILLYALFDLAVGLCHAFMLTHVFAPGTHNECLEIELLGIVYPRSILAITIRAS